MREVKVESCRIDLARMLRNLNGTSSTPKRTVTLVRKPNLESIAVLNNGLSVGGCCQRQVCKRMKERKKTTPVRSYNKFYHKYTHNTIDIDINVRWYS